MNSYHSTRSRAVSCTAKEAIRTGIAPDGGLFVSDALGSEKLDVTGLAEQSYADIANSVLQLLLPDYTADEIAACVHEAYDGAFASAEVTPLVPLVGHEADEGRQPFVLELFHGPTSAFKDVALQMLPRLMARTGSASDTPAESIMIVTATSGDTGKAALAGFADAPGTGITVFYPEGKVSRVQELQMTTQTGDNVSVCGVRGNFDDAQSAVKRIFADRELAERLAERGVVLSSANSINVGRLVPQVVYYFAAYAQLLRAGAIEAGDEVEFCVPTGNFGNILAAYYAKRMGVPLGMLYCASNENRVLTDFINTGTYDISERPFVLTPSPSMDILVSSNLERQLFELTGRDAAAIAGWMADLRGQRRFRVDEETFARVRELFASDSIDNATCLDTIKRVFEQHGYLLDPHTAVAYQTAENLRGENPVLIASTAHWAKFGDNVYRALHGIEPGAPLPDDVAALSGCKLNELIARETGVDDIPHGLAELDALPIRFDEVIDGGTNDIEAAALRFLEHLDD